MCLGVSDLMTPLTGLIHTQVLVHIWKKTTCEEIFPTENRLCQWDWRNTFRVRVWPPLILPLGQSRIAYLFILSSDRHHLACFRIGNLKSDPNIFQPNFALELLMEWIRAKHGKCKERSGLARESQMRESDGGGGGGRTEQGRATHIFPLLCFYLSSLRLTGNALHCFHENFFFYGKSQADY